ncbi:MAG: uroporphyrinogen decarboxylase family protein [Planctomycetota bacterium]|nr:uroporphyrinogen decarboxylase family protein [Planctomycetota bacterium]
MDGYFPFQWPSEAVDNRPPEQFIVYRDGERIITQKSYLKENGNRVWHDKVDVYYASDPPTHGIAPDKVHLPPVPKNFEPIEGVKPVDFGIEGLRRTKRLMSDQGLVGVSVINSSVLSGADDIYRLFDHPEEFEDLAEKRIRTVERRFSDIMAMEEDARPHFLCVGESGTLVFQTVEIFRKYALPACKRAIDLATDAGIPTHLHSCGPEKELVKIFAEETDLTVIDPLEIPPMGDCDLAELKRLYGHKIVLKGNLHTTEVMLRGSVDDVVNASKRAIDDAAEGGRFILSTGDQCGRDTPDENIRAMIETARTYGKY